MTCSPFVLPRLWVADPLVRCLLACFCFSHVIVQRRSSQTCSSLFCWFVRASSLARSSASLPRNQVASLLARYPLACSLASSFPFYVVIGHRSSSRSAAAIGRGCARLVPPSLRIPVWGTATHLCQDISLSNWVSLDRIGVLCYSLYLTSFGFCPYPVCLFNSCWVFSQSVALVLHCLLFCLILF